MNEEKKIELEVAFAEHARKHIVDTNIYTSCKGRIERDVVMPLASWIVAEDKRGTEYPVSVNALLYLVSAVIATTIAKVDPACLDEYRKLLRDEVVNRAFDACAEALAELEAERGDAGTK